MFDYQISNKRTLIISHAVLQTTHKGDLVQIAESIGMNAQNVA